jgi:hypothetical protein
MNWGLVAKIGIPTLLLACVIVAILAFFDVPIAPDEQELIVQETRPGVTQDPDVTESFFEFARRDEPFPPEWLVRVARVRWNDDGSLWAYTSLPDDQRQRRTTIETICEKLTAYVDAAGREFAGVSVRTAEEGAELLTRPDLDDDCRLPIPT